MNPSITSRLWLAVQVCLSVALLALCIHPGQAQDFEKSWQFEADNQTIVTAFTTDNQGDVLLGVDIFADSADINPNSAQLWLSQGSGSRAAVVKLDDQMNYQWHVYLFGTSSDIHIFDIQADSSQNVYVCGSIQSGGIDFDPDTSVTQTLTAVAATDGFLAKYSPSGALLWAKQLEGPGTNSFTQIAVSETGEIYAAGLYQDSCDVDLGAGNVYLPNTINPSHQNLFLAAYDQQGNYKWANPLNSSGNSYEGGAELLLDQNGGLVFAADYFLDIQMDPDTSGTLYQGSSSQEWFIARYDTAGAYQWGHILAAGSPGFQSVHGLGVDAQDRIYLTGYFTNDSLDIDPNPNTTHYLVNPGFWFVTSYVARYSNSGSLEMAETYESMNPMYEAAFSVNAQGDMLIFGFTELWMDAAPGPFTYALDTVNAGYLMRLDSNANLQWAEYFGAGGQFDSPEPYDAHLEDDGDFWISGYHRLTTDFDPTSAVFSLTGNPQEMPTGFVTKYNYCPSSVTFTKPTICQGDSFVFPDNTVATTGTTNISNFSSSLGCDSVLVTELVVSVPFSSFNNAEICPGDTFLFPSGSASSVAVTDTSYLTSSLGCDSNVVTYLSVKQAYLDSVQNGVCPGDTFTFPDGLTATVATLHTSFLQTQDGCDSTIVTDLSVNPVYNLSNSATICAGEFYQFPDGTVGNTNALHTSILTTSQGCDSLIQTTLVVLQEYQDTLQATICESDTYQFPDGSTGNQTLTQVSMLSATSGCDSVVVTQLTANPVYQLASNASICNGETYTFPDGSTATTSTQQTSFLTTAAGCDSVVITDLAVTPNYQDTVAVAICQGETYVFPDQSVGTVSTVQTSNLNSTEGCDSVIVTELQVQSIDTNVTMSNATLTSQSQVGTWQWFSCEGQLLALPVETGQSFTPIQNGSYAVVITDGFCSDTSACISILNVGINERASRAEFQVFPNPASDWLSIVSPVEIRQMPVRLRSIDGKLMGSYTMNGQRLVIDLQPFASGTYLVEVAGVHAPTVYRVVKD